MEIQAVLFDADGVILTPWRFAAYLEREHGLSRADTADFFRGVFFACLAGLADLKACLPPFLNSWGWPGDVEDFVATWLREDDAPDQRMLAAVRRLRELGLPCYLATNQERYRIAYMRETMGFATRFDGLLASAELGALKPQPAYYERAMARLPFPREAILFWDDSRHNVLAARQFGWRAEHFADVDAFEATLRRYVPAYAHDA